MISLADASLLTLAAARSFTYMLVRALEAGGGVANNSTNQQNGFRSRLSSALSNSPIPVRRRHVGQSSSFESRHHHDAVDCVDLPLLGLFLVPSAAKTLFSQDQ